MTAKRIRNWLYALLLLASPTTLTAQTQLTNNTYNDVNFDLSGNAVAFKGDDGHDGEIYHWSGGVLTRLTDNAFDDLTPLISGTRVAWSGYDATQADVFLWNGGAVSQLTNNPFDDILLDISGANLVWESFNAAGEHALFYYNGSAATQITTYQPAAHSFQAEVEGVTVVWVEEDGNDLEIYRRVGSTVTQLTNNLDDDYEPHLANGNIVWSRYLEGTDIELIFYNGAETQLTNNATSDLNARTSSGNVVWEGFDGADWEIYFWDGTNTVALTNNAIDDRLPEISGTNVVWQADGEIYKWDGTNTVNLTNSAPCVVSRNPRVSGSFMAWGAKDGADWEIYLSNGSAGTLLQNPLSAQQKQQPAGLTDSVLVWLRADGLTASNHSALPTWLNQAPPPDVFSVGNAGASGLLPSNYPYNGPQYRNNRAENLNNRPTAYFNGANVIGLAQSQKLSNSKVYEKTVAVVFRPNETFTGESRRVIYEQGGRAGGINLYTIINNGQIDLRGAVHAVGTTTPATFNGFVSPNIANNAPHIAVITFKNGIYETLIDGQSLGFIGINRNTLPAHPGGNGIGALNGAIYFYDGPSPATGDSTGAFAFLGEIPEVIHWNRYINETEQVILNNSLSSKYGVAMSASADKYAYDNPCDGHSYEVTGVGCTGTDCKTTASADVYLTGTANAGALDPGDFLLWGHNNDALNIGNWNVPAGIDNRFNRVWRADESGSVGTVDLVFQLPASATVNGADLRLLVATGDDFEHTTVQTLTGSYDSVNKILTFVGVDLPDGAYFTFGSVAAASQLRLAANGGNL